MDPVAIEWKKICCHLRERFTVKTEAPDWLGLVAHASAGDQLVVVKLGSGRAGPLIVVAVGVCRSAELSPWDALHYNGVAQRGALAVEGGAFSLRQLVALDVSEVDGAVEALVQEAGRIRFHHRPGERAARLFRPLRRIGFPRRGMRLARFSTHEQRGDDAHPDRDRDRGGRLLRTRF